MYSIDRIRFGGLSSGLDTENIIKQLMRIETMKVDRQFQQKALLEWKRDDYRTINNSLRNFKEKGVFDLKLESSFQAKTISSSDEKVAAATATATAMEGSYSINVISTAQAASAQSSARITGSVGTGSFTIQGTSDDASQATIQVTSTDTMADIAAKINAQTSKTGIRASYDENLGRMFLMSNTAGSENFIKVVADDNDILKNMNLYDPAQHTDGLLVTGTAAQIKLNNNDILEFDSNQISLLGMNITLKQEGTVNLSVIKDVDSAVNKIKAFVEQYNAVVDDLGTKLAEKRYRDFNPLTDEQKADMNEKDITQWEEKARSGLFRGDSLLSSIASSLRMVTSDAVDTGGEYKTLSSIGITTSPDWKDNGKLYIDENKLRAALADGPEAVMKFFNNESAIKSEQGLAVKLDNMLKTQMESIASTAGRNTIGADRSYLGKEISSMDDRISALQDRLISIEESYWNKFSAMERALQQMQSQSDWLTAQLSQTSR